MLGLPMVMTDEALASALASHETQAAAYRDSQIAAEQAEALRLYRGEPFGDEVEGRSRVVDRTVAIVIDNALPALLKPFTSTDEVVRYEPRGPEDEENAAQATEFINYSFRYENDGFMVLHDWFKDALLMKLGVVKVWWEDYSRKRTKTVVGLDAIGAESMLTDDAQVFSDDGMSYAVQSTEQEDSGCLRVACVPPEEFLVSATARNLEDADYCAHRVRKSRSDLLDMGFPADVVEALPKAAYDDFDDDPRRQARFTDIEGFGSGAEASDKWSERVQVCHEFVRVDYDGDNYAELREVVRAGNIILLNREVEERPFATLCPIPIPHRIHGESFADKIKDLQRISSVLQRQALDNLYMVNNPRPIIGMDQADANTFDDLQNSAHGAPIRMARADGLAWLQPPPVLAGALEMLRFAEEQQHARTGVTRIGQGMGPDVLKERDQTATGLQLVEAAQNQRLELVARIFAETGVRRLFRLMLQLFVQHQPRAKTVRLRNKWVEIDPSRWDPTMDVRVAVGLGVGSRAERAQAGMTALEVSRELLSLGLVEPKHVYQTAKQLFNALGFRDTDSHLREPQEGEQPQQPPDPDVMKAEADIQAQQVKLELERERAAADLQMAREKAAAELELAREEAALKAEMERDRAAQEYELARLKLEAEMQLAREKMAMEAKLAVEKAVIDHDAKIETSGLKLSTNRPGGSLAA